MAKNLKNKIILFLSHKSVSVTIILITIGSRLLQLIFFFNIRVDGMYQYLAMKYFVAGHGISIAEVLPENLSVPIYEPLINWPPGYSLLLSPFYVLFNHNYVAAGLTLDILAATALIIFTRKILKLLEIPVHLLNLYTLFSGFFIYNFYFIASSDAIAISIFIIALYQTMLLIKTDLKWPFRVCLISFLLILCGLIKYLFYPIVFVIPIFLIARGFIDKTLVIKKAGYISFILITVALGLLLLYQKSISGEAGYISQSGRGFFPENLSLAYPFMPSSFINPESISKAFSSITTAQVNLFSLFQFIHILSIITLIINITLWIRKKGFRRLNLINSFYTISILISFVIVALLTILSLAVAKEEINPGVMWSYIEDARYHGLITVVIQMCLFIIISQLSEKVDKKWKYTLVFLYLLLIPETFRGIYFDANRISKMKTEKYSWQQELTLQQFADNIIMKNRKKQPYEKVIVTGTHYYTNYRTCLYSNAFYLKNPALDNNFTELNTSKIILLLVIIESSKLNNFKTVLGSGNLKYEGNFQDFHFYTTYVKPN